jgi:hypothetical protein
VIVYAHTYPSDQASRVEFDAFFAWSAEHLPEDCSVWRTKMLVPGQPVWVVIVVDEHGASIDDFPWTGTHYELDWETARGFVARRVERMAQAVLTGEKGRITELRHFATEALAPRLTRGVWVVPE